MERNTVTFKIYLIDENDEKIENKEYIFNINEKIIDIKNKILKDIFNNKFNSLDLENITEKVYKDYGKLFFDKGLIPSTIDNYRLSEFTIDNRIFSFIVNGKNIEKNKSQNKKEESNFLKKIIKDERNNKNSDKGFIYYADEFPALK
jgi:hypothetical protein